MIKIFFLFLVVSFSARKCGELETVIPGEIVPDKWPWIISDNDCLGIKLEKRKILSCKNDTSLETVSSHPISILNPPGIYPFGFGDISIQNRNEESLPICLPQKYISFINQQCYRISKSNTRQRWEYLYHNE